MEKANLWHLLLFLKVIAICIHRTHNPTITYNTSYFRIDHSAKGIFFMRPKCQCLIVINAIIYIALSYQGGSCLLGPGRKRQPSLLKKGQTRGQSMYLLYPLPIEYNEKMFKGFPQEDWSSWLQPFLLHARNRPYASLSHTSIKINGTLGAN